MSSKFKPIDNNVILKRVESSEVLLGNKGLIYQPDTVEDKALLCKVIAVGPGTRYYNVNTGVTHFSSCLLKEGQIVYSSPFNGCKMKVDNEEYICIKESEILSVIETE